MAEFPTNPFPGLRPFEQKETHLFFGREKQIGQLVERLRRTRFLAVVGASGCGKSSLIRAGLLPTLLGDMQSPLFRAGTPSDMYGDMSDGQFVNWRLAILRPGDAPVKALASALSQEGVLDDQWLPDQKEVYTSIVETSLRHSSLGLIETVKEARLADTARLLVLVDQFEELFRFPSLPEDQHTGDEAKAFVDLLLNASMDPMAGIYIILTMRSDYLGQCMVFSGLPEAISNSQYLVPRLSRKELRASITGPIESVGEAISPRLVSRLLNQLGDDQDQLPILQHALMRLWDSWYEPGREKGPLDLHHLQRTSSLQNVLGEHAEEIYSSLSSNKQRYITERLFKIITETNAEGQGIRRPVSLEQICSIIQENEDAVIPVVERFRAPDCCFLMPPIGNPLRRNTIIDISHESLMRTWPRLKQWIVEEEDSARCYRRCLDTALQWKKGKGGLWDSIDSPELGYALSWQTVNKPSTDWAALYTSGRQISKAIHNYNTVKEFIELSDQERKKRQVAIDREIRIKKWLKRGVKLLMLVLIIMGGVWRISASIQQKMIVVGKNAVAKLYIAQQDPDPLMQALYLLEGEYSNLPEGADKLLYKVSSSYIPKAVMRVSKAKNSEEESITKIAINAEGSKIALGTGTGKLLIWNWQTSESPMSAGNDHSRGVTGLTFTPKGNGLVSSSFDGSVRFRHFDNGKEEALLYQGFEKDVQPGNTVKYTPVRSLAIGPKGESIVFGIFPGGQEINEVLILPLTGKTLRGDGEAIKLLELPSPAIALTANQEKLLIGSLDGTLSLLPIPPVENKQELNFQLPLRNKPRSTSVSLAQADTGQVAIGNEDGIIYVYSPQNNTSFPEENSVDACISSQPCPFSVPGFNCSFLKPDKIYGNVVGVGFWGDKIYGGYADGVVRIWQCDTEYLNFRVVISLKGHSKPITDVALNKANSLMVSSDSEEARVWHLDQFSENTIDLPGFKINEVLFSSEKKGSLVSAEDKKGLVKIFQIDQHGTGDEIITAGTQVSVIAMSRQGNVIVTGSEEGEITLWEEGAQWNLAAKSRGNDPIQGACYNSKRRVIYFSTPNSLMSWTPGNMPEAMTFDGKGPSVVALSEDETRLVAGYKNGKIKVWNDLDKSTALDLGNHNEGRAVNQVAIFNNDQVVSAGVDGRVCLWNLNGTGPECKEVAASDVKSVDVVTIDDESLIFSGGDEGEIQLIRLPRDKPFSEKELTILQIGRSVNGISSVKINYDASELLSTGGGGLRRWRLKSHEILEEIRERTKVSFTPDEREKYLFESSMKTEEY